MIPTLPPILITGATGFLGGALARRLAADGAHVRALARSSEKAAPLQALGIETITGDVTDADAMRRAAAGCGIVFHAAAALAGDYAKQHAVNVGGTANILNAATAAGVERLVYVSSIAVYGYMCAGNVTEASIPAPGADPYGQTKLESERLVQSSGIDYTIIRPGMIYGAGAVNWTGKAFRLARLKPTPFVGDGRGAAFPIYVDDVVDLLVTAATHPAAARQIFHCAPDPAPTWREFLGSYSRLAGHDRWLAIPPLPFRILAKVVSSVAPRRSMLRDLPDQVNFIQRRVTYKMDKARDLLGWEARISLDEGIARCAGWLRDEGLLS